MDCVKARMMTQKPGEVRAAYMDDGGLICVPVCACRACSPDHAHTGAATCGRPASWQADRCRCMQVRWDRVCSCVFETWQQGGVRGFYRGIGLCLARGIPVAMVALPTYDLARHTLATWALIADN
eukprot:COSAG01_NODE_684_length_14252_cov_4.041617_2_plen_125_part_00